MWPRYKKRMCMLRNNNDKIGRFVSGAKEFHHSENTFFCQKEVQYLCRRTHEGVEAPQLRSYRRKKVIPRP